LAGDGVVPDDVSFVITQLPRQGVLELDGAPVRIGERLAGQPTLSYQPGAAREGAGTDEFKFALLEVDDSDEALARGSVRVEIVEAVAENQVTLDDAGVVRIGGTSGNDNIVVTSDGLNLAVLINGINRAPNIPLVRVVEIRAWGRAGSDRIDLVDLAIRSLLHGGMGDDELNGGSGDDLMYGGAGTDKITGAAGNDLAIGGTGADRIIGSAGTDILVSEDIFQTVSRGRLLAALGDWVSGSGDDGETFWSVLHDAIFSDGDFDKLTGSSGSDWFITGKDDKITDFKSKDDDRVDVI
jgi:Ca2+-binding RTX toxin-like protein